MPEILSGVFSGLLVIKRSCTEPQDLNQMLLEMKEGCLKVCLCKILIRLRGITGYSIIIQEICDYLKG